MLDALRFVQGAVAKKDFVPALTHFKIADGFIYGFNGSLALCSPIELDLVAVPKAKPFVKAIETCKDQTVAMHLTANERLAIKSGKFKAYVECTQEDEFPDIQPEGELVPLNGGFLEAIKSMAPFMSEDASRPWALGLLFRGSSVFATNNIVLAERWLGSPFPVEVNIPASAIKELIRIKKEPISLQMAETSLTLHFEGGQWLRTQVSTLAWPDLGQILDRESNQMPLPEGFFEALEDIKPFVIEGDRVFFKPGYVATTLEEDSGAVAEVEGVPDGGVFDIHQFLKLAGIIQKMDLTQYPDPCLFTGDNIRGAIIGKRG